jgi:hypothetical protein
MRYLVILIALLFAMPAFGDKIVWVDDATDGWGPSDAISAEKT